MFGFICALNVPANALALWNQFKEYLCEDFRRNESEEMSYNRALLVIEDILNAHNSSCREIGLPAPRILQGMHNNQIIDVDEQQFLFNEMYEQANNEQPNIIDLVIREVQYHDTCSNVFCLTAHAGCG